MPKSPQSNSLPHETSNPLIVKDTGNSFDYSSSCAQNSSSECAVKKKKNADAQAAFRARRANYIATLEETVTSLESVIVQLQDSCRETRNEAAMLVQENLRLRHVINTIKEENRRRGKHFDVSLNIRNDSDCHPSVDNIQQFLPTNISFSQPNDGNDSKFSHSNVELFEPFASGDSGNKPNILHDEHTKSSGCGIYKAFDQPSVHHLMDNKFIAGQQVRYAQQHGSQARALQAITPIVKDDDDDMSGFNEISQRNSFWNDCRPPEFLADSPDLPSYSSSPTGSSRELHVDSQGRIIDDPTYHDARLRINLSSFLPSNSVKLSPSNSSPPSSHDFYLAQDFPGRSKSNTYYQSRPKEELTIRGGTADLPSPTKGTRYYAASGERPLLEDIFYFNKADCDFTSCGSRERNHAYLPFPSILRSLHTAPGSPVLRPPSPTPRIHPPISSTLAVIKAQAFGAVRKTRSQHTRLGYEERNSNFDLQGQDKLLSKQTGHGST